MQSQRQIPEVPLHHPRGYCVLDMGLADYDIAYRAQKKLVKDLKSSNQEFDYLILVEHPEVYTHGRRSMLPEETPTTTQGIPTFAIERGGEATYHNPGQLVGYPILKLDDEEKDLHLHLRRIENLLIRVLAEFHIKAARKEGATGVWVNHGNSLKKIASIGVAVSGWVTYHGFALNIDNDLSGFTRIRPCGFEASIMTSMTAELGEAAPSLETVKDAVVRTFGEEFKRLLVV